MELEHYLILKIGIGIGLFIALFIYKASIYKASKRKWRYKWNAILDKYTCPICSEMDGKILTEEEMRKSRPPLHGLDENNRGCRCYLTLVK